MAPRECGTGLALRGRMDPLPPGDACWDELGWALLLVLAVWSVLLGGSLLQPRLRVLTTVFTSMTALSLKTFRTSGCRKISTDLPTKKEKLRARSLRWTSSVR